jgi:hypothetical protein
MKRGDNRETAGGVAEYLAARPRQPKSDLIDSIRTRPVPGSPTEPRAPAGISSWDGVGVNVAAFAAAKNIRGINMIKKSIFALATAALTVGFTGGHFHAGIDHFRGRQNHAEKGCQQQSNVGGKSTQGVARSIPVHARRPIK